MKNEKEPVGWNTKRCCGRTALVSISNRFIADSQTEYRIRQVKSSGVDSSRIVLFKLLLS